jgi:Tol biopolymer transport system component
MLRRLLVIVLSLLAISTLLLHEPLSPKEVNQIRTDQYGDPLPQGAVARLGTVRVQHSSIITTIAWSPNGKILATGEYIHPIRLWDVATGKEIRRIDGKARSLAWSPQRNILASGWDDEDRTVYLWDVESGKQVRQLIGHELHGVESLTWSPDGSTLASAGSDKTVRLWDIATGKEVHRLVGHTHYVNSVAWSPDGKTLASSSHDDGTSRLWQAATGREIRRFAAHKDQVYSVHWSPDGKMLALDCDDNMVYLWELATGKEASRLSGVTCLAWSPDGKTLALGCTDKTIRLVNTVTDKAICHLVGHAGSIYSLVWSSDGKMLASVNGVHTVLIWAVRKAPDEPFIDLKLPQLESYWIDLTSDDSTKAYKAIRALAQGGKSVVSFLANRLKPVAPPDPNHISRLIDALDDNQFSIRQGATDELEKLGELAEPALRRSLSNNPSLEIRKRLDGLVKKLDSLSSERLRTLRAIMVLEYIGTPMARQVLESLATGARESRLTQEAKASLGRLVKHTAR